MSLRGSFGGFYFVIASYDKRKSSENDRKIAVSAQKAPKVRLMENLGLTCHLSRISVDKNVGRVQPAPPAISAPK